MLMFWFTVEIPDIIKRNVLFAIIALDNVKKNNIPNVNNFKICSNNFNHFPIYIYCFINKYYINIIL